MAGHREDIFPNRSEKVVPSHPRYHALCKRRVAAALDKNHHLRFLLKELYKRGCPLNVDRHFSCEPCGRPDKTSDVPAPFGGFDSKRCQIVICEDRITSLSNKRLGDMLAHKMINAFDHCRAHVDWDDMDHLACSEVRASLMSGECFYSREIGYKPFRSSTMSGQKQRCARRQAKQSLQLLGLNEEEAAGHVNKVFERCVRDTDPWDRIPP